MNTTNNTYHVEIVEEGTCPTCDATNAPMYGVCTSDSEWCTGISYFNKECADVECETMNCACRPLANSNTKLDWELASLSNHIKTLEDMLHTSCEKANKKHSLPQQSETIKYSPFHWIKRKFKKFIKKWKF